MIWELTLQSRLVELLFRQAKGFCSLTSTPTALRVNKDSRNAVLRYYSVCFGNILDAARTRFNFRLDTLYISEYMQPDFMHLFVGFTPLELENMEQIAISVYAADNDFDFIPNPSYNSIVDALRKLLPNMPRLRQIYEVHSMGVVFNLEGYSSHDRGTLAFYEDFPDDFMH